NRDPPGRFRPGAGFFSRGGVSRARRSSGTIPLSSCQRWRAWLGAKKEGAVAVPVVAIVGRPNVGKSSLFNWLAGRRIAIVEPTAGVTRDRLTALIQAGDQFLELIDTGGMEMKEGDALTPQVERQ